MNRVSAKYVFTGIDPRPLENAFVEYEDDGTVSSIGLCEDISKEQSFLEETALVPGFVNSHCHIELSYMQGLFSKGSGMAGFIDQINALRDTVPAERKKALVVEWMDTLYKRGVTALCDISNCSDSFEAKAASPLYTRTFLEVFGTEPSDCQVIMDGVQRLRAEALSFGLDAAPTPHAPYTMSPELLRAATLAGLDEGYVSYHCEESWQEDEMIRFGTGAMADNRRAAGMSLPPVCGTSSLEYFVSLLSNCPTPIQGHVLFVHEVCMSEAGADLLKDRFSNPYVALCPLSNLFIHNELPPVLMMRRKGLNLTIGTDSLSSNDDLDMVSELRCLQEAFPVLPTGELIRWACYNGAAFLGKENVFGSIEAGKRPGLVAISNLGRDAVFTPQSASVRII